jgi:hypothetical protein
MPKPKQFVKESKKVSKHAAQVRLDEWSRRGNFVRSSVK